MGNQCSDCKNCAGEDKTELIDGVDAESFHKKLFPTK